MVVLITAVALLTPVPVRATGQISDRVRYEGTERIMPERPLGEWLARLPVEPDFDWQTTPNWKGYIARWEVKDGALLLPSFEARKDGKDVPVEAVLPGQTLPARADWYTGRVHILIGEPVVRSPDGPWDSVFECVVVLRVEKGKVVRTEELKNARIKSPSEVREAERAKHALRPFPGLERGTVRAPSLPTRRHVCFIRVPPAALRRTPPWPGAAPDPPLSPLRAMLLAEAKSRDVVPPLAGWTWDLHKAALKPWAGDRYYYEFTFLVKPREAVSARNPRR